MEPIRTLHQLTAHLKTLNRRKRIAVVCANDPNTEYAIARALDEEEIAEFLMIGDSAILQKYPSLQEYPEYPEDPPRRTIPMRQRVKLFVLFGKGEPIF